MQQKIQRSASLGALTIFLMLTPPASAQQCGEYEVTAIIQVNECPPFGFPPTLPDGMNDIGMIVGKYQSCVIGPDVAFKWTAEEGLQVLPMPQGTAESRTHDVNNSPQGQIIGEFNLSGDGLGPLGFLLDGEEFIEISYPGGSYSNAAALNNNRQVVGGTSDGSPYSKAYIWEDRIMTIIEPTFGSSSVARDINDAGIVVGWMGNGIATDAHAFIYNGRDIIDIGLAPNTFASRGNAVEDGGAVVIWGRLNEGDPEARITASFLWEDGDFTDLGTLPGYDAVSGRDLNNDSKIVGMLRAIESSELPDTGFIWQDGIMTNLNDLLPQDSGLWIARAEAISNDGQITGFGEDAEGDVVGFVLTPIERPIGDLNGDCQITIDDLQLLLLAWGPCLNCKACPADLNNDCKVSTYDLLILLSNWG